MDAKQAHEYTLDEFELVLKHLEKYNDSNPPMESRKKLVDLAERINHAAEEAVAELGDKDISADAIVMLAMATLHLVKMANNRYDMAMMVVKATNGSACLAEILGLVYDKDELK